MFNKPNELCTPVVTPEVILDDLDNRRLLRETADYEDHTFTEYVMREERYVSSTWFETILDNITQ